MQNHYGVLYIVDDEPSDGPSGYFLVTGFSSVELFRQLGSIKLNAHVLIKVVGAADVASNGMTLCLYYEQHTCTCILRPHVQCTCNSIQIH